MSSELYSGWLNYSNSSCHCSFTARRSPPDTRLHCEAMNAGRCQRPETVIVVKQSGTHSPAFYWRQLYLDYQQARFGRASYRVDLI